MGGTARTPSSPATVSIGASVETPVLRIAIRGRPGAMIADQFAQQGPEVSAGRCWLPANG